MRVCFVSEQPKHIIRSLTSCSWNPVSAGKRWKRYWMPLEAQKKFYNKLKEIFLCSAGNNGLDRIRIRMWGQKGLQSSSQACPLTDGNGGLLERSTPWRDTVCMGETRTEWPNHDPVFAFLLWDSPWDPEQDTQPLQVLDSAALNAVRAVPPPRGCCQDTWGHGCGPQPYAPTAGTTADHRQYDCSLDA